MKIIDHLINGIYNVTIFLLTNIILFLKYKSFNNMPLIIKKRGM